MSSDTYQHVKEALPGLIFSSMYRFQELKECLSSECDSWTIKFEQMLVHSFFLLGYVSPRRFVWEVISNLLSRTAYIVGDRINYPTTESDILVGISLLEQLGLTYIWDYVRGWSICMRFNNCDNDFLTQIGNIKISACNVSIEDLNDDKRTLSVCEKIFNDSPLILLAGAMVILTIVTFSLRQDGGVATPPISDDSGSGEDNGDGAPPPNPGSDSGGGNGDGAPPPNPGSDSGGDNGDGAPPPNSVNGVGGRAPPQGLVSSGQGAFSPFSFNLNTHVSPRNAPNDKNVSPRNSVPPPTQDIDAECPNCKKKFTCSVPNPWTLCCAQVLSSVKKRNLSKSDEKNDAALEKVINELFKNIKCRYCKDKLKKKLEAIKSRTKTAKSKQKCKKSSK